MITEFLYPILKSSRLVLLGPPCCGKGTLAQSIVSRFTLPHVSTGEIFRSHLNEGTPFGEEIRQCMQEGKLIPDQLVTDLTLKKLRSIKSGFILDGFPRTLVQAEILHKHFDSLQAYHLHVDDETVIQRLSGRLTCGSCGSVFNIIFCPPRQEGVCDHCHDELIHRSDDTREIVMERLRVYHKYSKPVVDFYRRLGILINIETGDLKPDDIFRRAFLS
jgi:adenylate kinase